MWSERFLTAAEIEPLLPVGVVPRWPALVGALMNRQKQSWPLLREGLDDLSRVVVKEFALQGVRLLAQYNPRRLTSTTASVDDEAIRRRPCFLCPDALPPEEKALAYGRDFVILCNPFPILPGHLTIAHRRHIGQAVVGFFDPLLDLAHDLSPDYVVLYNGPRCGASAPDHLHFQAARRGRLPLEERLEEASDIVLESETVALSLLTNYPATVLVLRGSDRATLHRWFTHVLECLGRLTHTEGEPLINLLVLDDHEPTAESTACQWTVAVFPRARHRPACFYAEGEERLLISPAALDLAGLVVVPRREDFERLTPGILADVFADVTLPTDAVQSLKECLSHLVRP